MKKEFFKVQNIFLQQGKITCTRKEKMEGNIRKMYQINSIKFSFIFLSKMAPRVHLKIKKFKCKMHHPWRKLLRSCLGNQELNVKKESTK